MKLKNSWNDGVTAGQLTPITWTNPSTSTYRTNFNTLKYPFVNWNNQIRTTAIDPNPQLTSLETAFRPFISVKYLIDRIFQNSPFTLLLQPFLILLLQEVELLILTSFIWTLIGVHLGIH